jgi:hypothetical protein
MRSQNLQGWALGILGAAVLSGCNAVAEETTDATASLMAVRPGGVLACFGQRVANPALDATITTQLAFTNHNDNATIVIDRLVVYRWDGTFACQDEPWTLGPHQSLHRATERFFQCPDWLPEQSVGSGNLSFIVYWSYKDSNNGPPRPLDGATWVVRASATAGSQTSTSFECKPVAPGR